MNRTLKLLSIQYTLFRSFPASNGLLFKDLVTLLNKNKTTNKPKMAILETIENVADRSPQSLPPVLSLLCQQVSQF